MLPFVEEVQVAPACKSQSCTATWPKFDGHLARDAVCQTVFVLPA